MSGPTIKTIRHLGRVPRNPGIGGRPSGLIPLLPGTCAARLQLAWLESLFFGQLNELVAFLVCQKVGNGKHARRDRGHRHLVLLAFTVKCVRLSKMGRRPHGMHGEWARKVCQPGTFGHEGILVSKLFVEHVHVVALFFHSISVLPGRVKINDLCIYRDNPLLETVLGVVQRRNGKSLTRRCCCSANGFKRPNFSNESSLLSLPVKYDGFGR
mmetsp:Transcript_3517/g.9712  ORF Transcript_3517/g.9712 Transcript_3517/m.9712 type:complete len:212 (+) Transcript_3517:2242-2877(+)